MKMKMMKMGFLSLGVSMAFVSAPLLSEAAENGNSDLLGVNVNVLSKEEGKSSVVDVELSDVPLLGDVNVNIPSKPMSDEDGTRTNAVATVNVSDGVLDEVDVTVLEKSETDGQTSESKVSLASVGISSELTNDVNVDIGSGDAKVDGNGSSSFDGGLVEVNTEELPVLGETHVGVLDRHESSNKEGESLSAGVVQADLDNELLKDTSVKVLATEQAFTADSENSMSAVADVHVSGGVLEGLVNELDVSVLEKTDSTDGDAIAVKGSLASIGLTSDLTDYVNVYVASGETKNDGNGSSSFDGGLVEVNTEELPALGETHVGVLDRHESSNKEGESLSAGVVQADLDNELLKDTSVKVLATEQTSTADSENSMSAVADVHVGGGVLEGLVNELDVSVLEKTDSTDGDATAVKGSLASIGLTSDLTNDVNVDVLADETMNDGNGMSSFDGGLVEVNAEELPVLGETHVGVLDKHVSAKEEGIESTSGLVQADLLDGLLDETHVGVLTNKVEVKPAGVLVTDTGIGLDVGLPVLGNPAIHVLQTQRLFPAAGEVAPSPGEGTSPSNPNDETVTPNPGGGTTIPTPGDETVNPNPGDGTTSLQPGDGTTTPNLGDETNPSKPEEGATAPNPGDGNTAPGSVEGTTPSSPGSTVNSPGSDNTGITDNNNSMTDEDVAGPPAHNNAGNASGGNAGSPNKDAASLGTMGAADLATAGGSHVTGKAGASVAASQMAMSHPDEGASLPKTGGLFDAGRTALLASLLLLAGVMLMLSGRLTKSGRKWASRKW